MKLLQHSSADVPAAFKWTEEAALLVKTERQRGILAEQPAESSWLPGGIWGLGLCRTLQELEQFRDVQFANGVIGKRALLGGSTG